MEYFLWCIWFVYIVISWLRWSIIPNYLYSPNSSFLSGFIWSSILYLSTSPMPPTQHQIDSMFFRPDTNHRRQVGPPIPKIITRSNCVQGLDIFPALRIQVTHFPVDNRLGLHLILIPFPFPILWKGWGWGRECDHETANECEFLVLKRSSAVTQVNVQGLSR